MDEIENRLVKSNWVISSEEEMDVFKIPNLEVTTKTQIYSKDGISSTVGLEIPVFIFVSKLIFSTSVPSSGMKLIRGIVKRESKQKFTQILENKGLKNVKVVDTKQQVWNECRIDQFSYESNYTQDGDSYDIKSECFVLHTEDNYYILGYSHPIDKSILVSNSNESVEMEARISEVVDEILT